MRRKLLFIGALCAAVGALAVPAALADSASFHYANASLDTSTGALNVDFKLTGLGTGVSSVEIDLNAVATATYQCWNNGGRHPKAGNKETVTEPLAVPGTFDVNHGQVTDTFVAGPPGAGDFTCPEGQTLYLESVSYSSIGLQTAGEGSGFAATDASPSSIDATGIHILIG